MQQKPKLKYLLLPKLPIADIPILNLILLSLCNIFPRSLNSSFTPQLFQILKLHNLTHNKRFLKISMNNPCSLRCFCPLSNCPSSYFIRSTCEIITKSQSLVSRDSDFGKSGFSIKTDEFGFCFFIREFRKTIFKSDGERNAEIAGVISVDPLFDFCEMFVFLTDIIFFREIDEVYYWFCC